MDRRRRTPPNRTPDEICADAYRHVILNKQTPNPYRPGTIEHTLWREARRVAELSVHRGIPLAQ